MDFLLGRGNWDHDSSSSGKALGWEKNGFVRVRADALDPAVGGELEDKGGRIGCGGGNGGS